MPFSEDLTKKAQQVAGAAAEKAKDLAGTATEMAKAAIDTAKMNMEILSEQREIGQQQLIEISADRSLHRLCQSPLREKTYNAFLNGKSNYCI